MFKKKLPTFLWGTVILFLVIFAVPQGVQGDDQEPPEPAVRHYKFRLSFHVGATYPLNFGTKLEDMAGTEINALNGLADSNVHVRFNLDYALTDKLDLVAFWGFSQFTDDYYTNVHYYTFNFSVNWKLHFNTPTGLRWYLQAGPGRYIPKPNLSFPYPSSSTFGFNVGFGAQIPLSGPFDIEWGIDLHNINISTSDEPKYWFLTLQLGVLFR
ncbi:MAG: porin family protein [bacterium]|nr:porin family protein [bacterium]